MNSSLVDGLLHRKLKQEKTIENETVKTKKGIDVSMSSQSKIVDGERKEVRWAFLFFLFFFVCLVYLTCQD